MPPEIPRADLLKALKTGEPWDAEGENAALTEAEAARRKRFYEQCVAVNLDIATKHREAIQEAMARRKTGAWASYDGRDVTLHSLRVKDNTIIITFDFFDGMNLVDEKIAIE